MTNCRYCGKEIKFKDSAAGKKYPVNMDDSFHNCRSQTSTTATQPKKLLTKQARWEGIKTVKEIRLNEVNEHLLGGWVILDRVERMVFEVVGGSFNPMAVSTTSALGTASQFITPQVANRTESIYVVGMRA